MDHPKPPSPDPSAAGAHSMNDICEVTSDPQIRDPDNPNSPSMPSISASLSPPKLTEFHLFPNLPPELRIRIWSFCTPPAAVIAVSNDNRWAEYTRRRIPVPAVLHACKDSRQEFLHREGVTKEHPTYTLHSCGGPMFYVSIEQDILFYPFLANLTRVPHLLKAQNVLSHVFNHEIDTPDTFLLTREMSRLECLQKVYLTFPGWCTAYMKKEFVKSIEKRLQQISSRCEVVETNLKVKKDQNHRLVVSLHQEWVGRED
ncbi:hypothetical protein HYFRA_00000098 [Hymenoscyphus fraxineus]|uniref:2EXR domain-containing protein n=1 Tax=Hymenoscyphus fraxineus TaxID=746836 RepID=A0A9N9L0A6_9HELO|nr:hypothetical protein HYFRA_00000098 [Hymenoscyphus fraxineus]